MRAVCHQAAHGVGRTPQGVRGLKFAGRAAGKARLLSHPARGAWIEISRVMVLLPPPFGRTPQGVRGLKCSKCGGMLPHKGSHPARGAWIEIRGDYMSIGTEIVAPRKGCVD